MWHINTFSLSFPPLYFLSVLSQHIGVFYSTVGKIAALPPATFHVGPTQLFVPLFFADFSYLLHVAPPPSLGPASHGAFSGM
jgi:hypothetical protein